MTYNTDKSIVDPALSRRGKKQCRLFAVKHGLMPHIILTSPLTRAMKTSLLSFPQPSSSRIWALAELRSYSRGPNGTGLPLEELEVQYSSPFAVTSSVHLDYVEENWEKAFWAMQGRQRIVYFKDFLTELAKECPKRRLEVAVVSHSSFLRELLSDEDWDDDLELGSFEYDSRGQNFKRMTEKEMNEKKKEAVEGEKRVAAIPAEQKTSLLFLDLAHTTWNMYRPKFSQDIDEKVGKYVVV